MKKLYYKDVIKEFEKNPVNHDLQFNDPLGIEQARINKFNTLEIDPESDNIIDKFLLDNMVHKILGKRVWCVKDDKSQKFVGYIKSVSPIRVLLIKTKEGIVPVTFESVFSMEK